MLTLKIDLKLMVEFLQLNVDFFFFTFKVTCVWQKHNILLLEECFFLKKDSS